MWGGSGGAQAVGWPWGHRMRPGYVEWAPGVVLGVQVGPWAGGWLFAQRVGSGHLGSSRGKVAAGPVGALGRRGVGEGWGGAGAGAPGVSQHCARGAGLPGAGVRGTGGGDRVPAGPPGKTPHVSHTRWRGEGGFPHYVPSYPPYGTPPCMSLAGDTGLTTERQPWGMSPNPYTISCPCPVLLVPKLTRHLWSQGGPREAVWDHPAAG